MWTWKISLTLFLMSYFDGSFACQICVEIKALSLVLVSTSKIYIYSTFMLMKSTLEIVSYHYNGRFATQHSLFQIVYTQPWTFVTLTDVLHFIDGNRAKLPFALRTKSRCSFLIQFTYLFIYLLFPARKIYKIKSKEESSAQNMKLKLITCKLLKCYIYFYFM
jgi:hypothetical protein